MSFDSSGARTRFIQQIRRIDLNTGIERFEPRPASRDISFRHTVRNGGGFEPNLLGYGWGTTPIMFPLDVKGCLQQGAATFYVARLKQDVLERVKLLVVCWRDEFSAEAWERAREGAAAYEQELRATGRWADTPTEAPIGPWVAELTLPCEPNFDFPTTEGALDRFVECLPWAFIAEDEKRA